MEENELEIKSLETNILEMVCETPDGCDSLMWPQGKLKKKIFE